MPSVRLRIGNEDLSGWTDAAIRRSLDTIAGSFTIGVKDTDTLEERIALTAGKPVSIAIDDETLITGYIDDYNPDVSAGASQTKLVGRCKTGDLVDCSTTNKPGTWKNAKPENIIRQLLNPNGNSFDIGLQVEADLGGELKEFSSIGKTVFDCISEILENKAAIPVSNGKGNLVITNVGDTKADDDLFYGVNIASASMNQNYLNRFSEYIVKGQQSTGGDSWSKSNTEKFATASDQYIERFRPKLITVGNDISSKGIQDRANWEAQIRAGRSIGVNVTLPTWLQSSGKLWRENMIVYVSIPKFRVDGDMLIQEISYNQNATSKSTQMKLVDPSIYKKEPKPVVKKKSSGGWVK